MVHSGEQPRWQPVDRNKGAQVPAREGRVPVRNRTPEEQVAYRARVEAQQAEAKREAPINTAERTADEQWEDRRQELVARGDIFDDEGNITEQGEGILRASGWGNGQMVAMERMQKNHAAKVEVLRPAGSGTREAGRMSSVDAGKMAREARTRANQELQDRVKREEAQRNAILGRQRAGLGAYQDAIRAGYSDADAERAQREAEQAFDRAAQQEKINRAA